VSFSFLCSGIDGLAKVYRERLRSDPFSGAVFVFRSRRGHAMKLLVTGAAGR
jgi:transposase